MIPIDGGTYQLGSDFGDPRIGPCYEVELDPYLVGDRCVTAADFLEFLQAGAPDVDHTMVDCIDPCFVVHRRGGFVLRGGAADFPMIQVSFWGAAGYCNWISRAEGLSPVYDMASRGADLDQDGYRLPTEAEWEVACRLGQRSLVESPDACNTSDAGPECLALRAGRAGVGAFGVDAPSPVPSGSLSADGVGLHEMIGNIREWCHDRYRPGPPVIRKNPAGPARGAFRVVRGGAFIDSFASSGPSVRQAAYEHTKCEVYGFRVARADRGRPLAGRRSHG